MPKRAIPVIMKFIDYTQCTIAADTMYNRIVSLVPSTSESIVALGAGDRLIGVTRFCTDPKHIMQKLPKVGGTKNIDIGRIEKLKPDLILANAEENTREDIMALREKGFNVYVSFPKTIHEALRELKILASLLSTNCDVLCTQIESMLHSSQSFSYIYLIWNNPLMTITADCFIASMLAAIGGENACSKTSSRYPTLSFIPPDIDCLLLSSEPFPFKEKHRQQIHQQYNIPLRKIVFIDGSYCSWHGTRMLSGLRYLKNWSTQQCFSSY